MAWSVSTPALSSTLPFLRSSFSVLAFAHSNNPLLPLHPTRIVKHHVLRKPLFSSSSPVLRRTTHLCRAAEYKFPDPIPEFADAELEKFKEHLTKKLSKKDIFGDSIQEVVGICTDIFGTFLHSEYGGPGTLLVVPFIDMADTINERGLPGGPQAARTAVKWAQKHVDKDWNEWNGEDSN